MAHQVADPFKALTGIYEDTAKEYWAFMRQFFKINIPIAFRDVQFDLIDESYRADVHGCLIGDNDEKGLFVSGPVGTGKTSTLYVMLKFLLWHRFLAIYSSQVDCDIPEDAHQIISNLGRQYSFVTHFELVRQLRAYYEHSNIEDRHPPIFHHPLLFVDDLGRGYDDKSGWNTALLDEFFDYRYQRRLRVFVTTNKTPQELRNWEGWERVVDRLCDPSWMRTATVTGESKRTQQWIDAHSKKAETQP